MKQRVIAFYLPQFYPTPENDEWWEPGFTEWTNVAKARPLFKGHYQPRIPRDLGFYDLRVPETRERQVELAREAGIEGFCYWHYWFGNGKRLLDRVFNEVVTSGKPDYPFCLCWANHSWYAKTWNKEGTDKLLIEQTYPGENDFIEHFYAMLPSFKDKRYMKINDKLIFGIFDPWNVDIILMSDIWNELARQNGLKGFHFFALCQGTYTLKLIKKEFFNSIVLDPLLDITNKPTIKKKKQKANSKDKAFYIKYEDYVSTCIKTLNENPLSFPCIEPNFDHTPRSGTYARILHNSTPKKWGELCKSIAELYKYRPTEENLVFIKSWNEWGEGNYLEPDQKYGKGYIEEMSKIFK
ncbi:MAG: glycoside hydrolase family 99-like domain-containing protein [Prevotella sp.]|nr:glycoside hydrolase family 99-like domain-containing protein [Prevotella sp.]